MLSGSEIDFLSSFALNLFKRFVTPLEKTLKIELFNKDVELNLLHVGFFTFFSVMLNQLWGGGLSLFGTLCKYVYTFGGHIKFMLTILSYLI